MSDGRKIFKFLKWIESAQKSRWAMERMSMSFWNDGPGFMTIIHGLDTVAYSTSFFYYVLDNVLWCTKVGMLRSKIIPGTFFFFGISSPKPYHTMYYIHTHSQIIKNNIGKDGD